MPDELRFVGREKQFETLRSAVNSLKNNGRALLLVGPAGCGKSALLGEFDRRLREDRKITEHGKVIVIRDNLSRYDDPQTFLSRVNDSCMREINSKSMGIAGWVKKKHSYLDRTIDAIKKGTSSIIPDGVIDIPMKINLPSIRELPNNTALLFQAFFADLAEFSINYPDKRFVLMVDGYHNIIIEDIFNSMFNDIIRNIQDMKNVMIVIASRKPEFDFEIQPLGMFEALETESFLRANPGLEDKTLISNIHALLGGSPYRLGLLTYILNTKRIKGSNLILNLPETGVDDYLNRRFIESMPQNVQRFLMEVCMLQVLDENVCKFIVNQEQNETDLVRILAMLKKSTVLEEIGRDGKMKRYRLCDSFREFLMAECEVILPGMHIKAAEYYEHKIKMRLTEEIELWDVRAALYHSLESGNIDVFVTILNEHEIGLRTSGYFNELKYYFSGINFEEISDDEVKSEALYNYGITSYLTGDMQKALDMFERSMEIEKQRGNLREIALTMHQMAMIHIETRDYESALDLFEKAMHVEEILGDPVRISATLQQIAMIYFVRGEYDRALDRYEMSLQINQQIDLSGAASILHQIANIQRKMGEFDRALDTYEKTMAIEKKLGDRRMIAYTTAKKGLVCLNLGRLDEAVRLLKAALEIFDKIGPEMAAEKIRARLETIKEG